MDWDYCVFVFWELKMVADSENSCDLLSGKMK